MIEHARNVQLHAVRQMPAMGQVEAQHRVARLDGRQIDGHVGLAAGVGLDVGMLGAEQLLGPIAGQILDHVDMLAAAVIAPAGIAFGIFVRQHAADRLHDGRDWCSFRWRSSPGRPADGRFLRPALPTRHDRRIR